MGPLIFRTFLLGLVCLVVFGFIGFLLRGHQKNHPKLIPVIIGIGGFVFCALIFIMYLEGQ